MKNKIFRLFAFLMATLLIVFSFSACSASKSYESNAVYDTAAPEEPAADYVDSEMADVTANADISANVKSERKIIETIDLSVQTKTFDALLEDIDKQIASLGGYVENSSISGREMDSYNNRYAEMTIRIPADKSDAFSGFISENSVVVNRSVSTEDVTLTYVDMESRVSALETQKASLERLLADAESMEDIITIQSELTNVIYEIESYKSQLRTFDNLVDYCTVNIYINEVERTVVVEEQSVWQEISTNLEENFSDMWDGMVNIFVFIVSAIPFLIPLAVIAVVVIVIVIVCRKSAKRKALNRQETQVNYQYNPNANVQDNLNKK